jgi:hypothetical protein
MRPCTLPLGRGTSLQENLGYFNIPQKKKKHKRKKEINCDLLIKHYFSCFSFFFSLCGVCPHVGWAFCMGLDHLHWA